MRIFFIFAITIPFIYWMVSDGLRKRSKPVVLVPDLLFALSNAPWEKAAEGLDYKLAQLENSLATSTKFSLHVWRFDPEKFRLSVVTQYKDKGSRIKDYREKEGALLAINGGYFAIEQDHRLTPSGFVAAEGKELAPYRKGGGSGLYYDYGNSNIGIGWSRQAIKDKRFRPFKQALQAGPLVVDPGGKNGISRNDGKYAKRTVLCRDFKGRFLIIIIDGKITLYETGKLLSTSVKQGGLECERALNLDGGPSTMLDYNYKGKSVYLSGRWPVVNALVLHKK